MWKNKLNAAIGGLEDIGFIDDGNKLLVLSSQGLSVFHCLTGERLYRSDVQWWPLFDQTTNALTKVFDYYPSPVNVFGLHTQLEMQTKTADGWQLLASEPEPEEPPFEKYVVTKIYLVDTSGSRMLVATDGPCELQTFGFSETGNTLVVATGCEIILWSRD